MQDHVKIVKEYQKFLQTAFPNQVVEVEIDMGLSYTKSTLVSCSIYAPKVKLACDNWHHTVNFFIGPRGGMYQYQNNRKVRIKDFADIKIKSYKY